MVTVISIGGSIIVPDDVDYKFLKSLKKLLLNLKKQKVVIVAGGGSTCRKYIKPLIKEKISEHNQHVLGIESTRLNAKLLALFLQKCNTDIPQSIEGVTRLLKKHNIVVVGGLKPGMTSDGTTARIAKYVKADTLINMTNVKGLYTKDPRKHKDAKFIKELSHANFKKMIDKVELKPGQHFVLDAVAANITRKSNIDVVIMKGLGNLDKFLNKKKFTGTIIS